MEIKKEEREKYAKLLISMSSDLLTSMSSDLLMNKLTWETFKANLKMISDKIQKEDK